MPTRELTPTMFEVLVAKARKLLGELDRSLVRPLRPAAPSAQPPPPLLTNYFPLRRVVLSDAVSRTLFEEYAGHRQTAKGDEETGWVLLGLREADEAVVLATLPAGTDPDASATHIRFVAGGQVLGSRIVRQADRRLTILGVAHTHPGSLRRPSDGDLHGDSQWVRSLRGREGVFAIGTADGPAGTGVAFAHQPARHVQCLGPLRFSWYALRQGEPQYRPLPADVTLGPDLAAALRPAWPVLEAHAERIDRLCRQVTGVRLDVLGGDERPMLGLTVPLPEPGAALRVLVRKKDVGYYLIRGDQVLEVEHHDYYVDRGVYLLLAELAAHAGEGWR